MNIFATSACPRGSAEALDDARVVSQLRETAQLLSTAVRIVAPRALDDDLLYRMSHEAHPVARWVRRDQATFQWALHHGLALHSEYAARWPGASVHNFARTSRVLHGVLSVHRHAVLPEMPTMAPISGDGMCNHAANLSVGLDFRTIPDTFQAYREYLLARWQIAKGEGRRPRFTGRGAPAWAMQVLS